MSNLSNRLTESVNIRGGSISIRTYERSAFENAGAEFFPVFNYQRGIAERVTEAGSCASTAARASRHANAD